MILKHILQVMKEYLSNWNFMRLLRLALGIMILIQGIHSNDLLLTILGALFSLMPLLNIGCCGAGNCRVPVQKTIDTQTEESTYEEVK